MKLMLLNLVLLLLVRDDGRYASSPLNLGLKVCVTVGASRAAI